MEVVAVALRRDGSDDGFLRRPEVDGYLLNQLAAETIQFAHRHDDLAFEPILQHAKLHAGFAEAAQLRAQSFHGERTLLRDLQGHLRFDDDRDAFATPLDLQSLADATRDDDFERMFWFRQLARPAFAQFAVKLGIVRFPEEMAELDDLEVELAVLEGEPHGAVPQGQDFIDASALLAVGVAAAIDDDAVAGFEGSFGFDLDITAPNGADRADERAALFSVTSVDEFLVIHAVHPARIESA